MLKHLRPILWLLESLVRTPPVMQTPDAEQALARFEEANEVHEPRSDFPLCDCASRICADLDDHPEACGARQALGYLKWPEAGAHHLSATNRPHRRIANGHNQLHMSRWRQGRPADRPPHVHDEGISG